MPGKVDLPVIATAGNTVPGVIRECAAAGVRAAAVISAGFKECGGAFLEQQALSMPRRRAMEERTCPVQPLSLGLAGGNNLLGQRPQSASAAAPPPGGRTRETPCARPGMTERRLAGYFSPVQITLCEKSRVPFRLTPEEAVR